MFRGIFYRTSTYRSNRKGEKEELTPGTLNIKDYVNYSSSFNIISSTGADFLLNGEIVPSGVNIADEGYYEAYMPHPTGGIGIYRFCFILVNNIDIESKVNPNSKSELFLYSKMPVVVRLDRTVAGIISNYDTFNKWGYEPVSRLSDKKISIFDETLQQTIFEREFIK